MFKVVYAVEEGIEKGKETILVIGLALDRGDISATDTVEEGGVAVLKIIESLDGFFDLFGG
jgi:hypothetical protein